METGSADLSSGIDPVAAVARDRQDVVALQASDFILLVLLLLVLLVVIPKQIRKHIRRVATKQRVE